MDFTDTTILNADTLAHKQLMRLLNNQGRHHDILFLENSNCLDDAAENFRTWCVNAQVRHNIIHRIDELPMEYLMEELRCAKFIAFQTTGTYEIVKEVTNYLKSENTMQRTIIECFVSEPTFKFLPTGVKHKMYALDCYEDNMQDWHLYRLSGNYYSNNRLKR